MPPIKRYQPAKFLSLLLFCFVIIPGINAQNLYPWAWVNGNVPASWGIRKVPAGSNQPSPRALYGRCKDKDGNIWVFGGFGADVNNSSGNLNDLWKYNPRTNEWSWMAGSSDRLTNIISTYGTMGVADAANVPGARYAPLLWCDLSGNIWMFGGVGYDGNGNMGSLNDMWKYDPAQDIWTWMKGTNVANNQTSVTGTRGVESPANQPFAVGRSTPIWPSAVYCQAGNYLWFIESFGPEIWRFNTLTNNWTFFGKNAYTGTYGTMGVPDAANAPGIRTYACLTADKYGNLWLFGGYGHGIIAASSSLLNDLWKYNTATDQWTWMSGSNTYDQIGIYGTQGTSASGNHPGARRDASITCDSSGAVWLFGGNGLDAIASTGNQNDLWRFNPVTSQWTWMANSRTAGQATVFGTLGISSVTNHPGAATIGGFCWFDQSKDSLWLYSPSNTNEVWGFTYLSVVPVKFISFSAATVSTGNLLLWQTANEYNNNHFEVQRSMDGVNFITIGNVKTGSLLSTENKYRYTDEEVVSKNIPTVYYRVKQVDNNAGFSYSTVLTVSNNKSKPGISLAVNPVANKTIALTFRNQPAGNYAFNLLTNSGQLVLKGKINHLLNSINERIDVRDDLAPGLYILEIEGPGMKKQSITVLMAGQ